jgi:hypothetical protein
MSAAHADAHGNPGDRHTSSGSTFFTFVGLLVVLALMIAVGMMRVEGSALYDPEMSLQTQLLGEILLGVGAAVLVVFFFMNLRFESRFMKLFLLLPLAFPVVYSIILISEAIWRRKW